MLILGEGKDDRSLAMFQIINVVNPKKKAQYLKKISCLALFSIFCRDITAGMEVKVKK